MANLNGFACVKWFLPQMAYLHPKKAVCLPQLHCDAPARFAISFAKRQAIINIVLFKSAIYYLTNTDTFLHILQYFSAKQGALLQSTSIH